MTEQRRLLVGFDDFKKIRENQFYYVDKTRLIEQLLENWGEVNLFYQTAQIWKKIKYEHAQELF